MTAFPYHIQIILLLSILSITTLNFVTCTSKVRCNDKDMNTLLNFKKGVTDPSGLLSSSWLPEKDCCQWKGIQCNNITGRVTQLSLPCHTAIPVYGNIIDKSHCLTGELHLSLLLHHLQFLTFLNLSNNDFETIQYNYNSSATNTSNLYHLDLSYNDNLVIDNLGRWMTCLSSLKYLDLSGIDLHSQTDWLQSVMMLPSLVELYLASCRLQNIYPSLDYANFTSLEHLTLADNHFASKLPNWIFNLSSHISFIDISDSYIHGQLPKTLSNLRSLASLDLSWNSLDGPIPDWLGRLEQLQRLDLSVNSFFGPIPTSLGNLSSLVELTLSSNHLGGELPEKLGKISSLETLNVKYNFLVGNISERNFRFLSNLIELSLGSPGLILDFDPKWIPPFQLQYLWLGYVHPKLPSWLYTQNSLEVLNLVNSRSSFEPHDKFWKFAAQIEYLNFANNSINADMSNVLLNSKFLWLPNNNLRGGVPRLSSNVIVLDLSRNYLCGSISPLLCDNMKEKANLEVLDLSDNVLSGKIPNCWIHWKSLLLVDLGHNNLTGEIPDSVGFLSNLMSLELNDNKLSGQVPLALKDCRNMWILDLRGNKFRGVIPSWIGNVKALVIRSNQFSGNIPVEICQLHSLKILDFANNRFSGVIPDCLHNMTTMVSNNASIDDFFILTTGKNVAATLNFNLALLIKGTELPYSKSMYAIDLSSNNLSGTMPLELFMLTRLQSLNLSHNQLVGILPQEIGNLKQLESLDLSSNRLSGQIPQSMSSMSFLEVLNLSFNHFTGVIPSGTQLQSFTNLSYTGNPKLCGPPLTAKCTQDGESHNTNSAAQHDGEESQVRSWFYMGLGMGFATSFWGVFGVILFNRRCRLAYFRFLGKLYDMMILKMNSIYYSLKSCSSSGN